MNITERARQQLAEAESAYHHHFETALQCDGDERESHLESAGDCMIAVDVLRDLLRPVDEAPASASQDYAGNGQAEPQRAAVAQTTIDRIKKFSDSLGSGKPLEESGYRVTTPVYRVTAPNGTVYLSEKAAPAVEVNQCDNPDYPARRPPISLDAPPQDALGFPMLATAIAAAMPDQILRPDNLVLLSTMNLSQVILRWVDGRQVDERDGVVVAQYQEGAHRTHAEELQRWLRDRVAERVRARAAV